MIKYIVDLKINSSIYDEFLLWLSEHVHEILCLDGFTNAEIYEESDLNINNEIRQLIVNYELTSRQHLQNYFDNHATNMRNKTTEMFGNNVIASRRIFSIKKVINKS
ncbi:MAG: hypothetical protein A3E82_00735 [Gammaproteobacteria bacterium RIFCSPHIGHO2_12_FULL_38_11]|nr:MAG: hypothetical protein A3E82_00735 [Gammaproteobacteria bacterium RIFCSPHIGHO2_12_FULL_38_11]